MMRTLAELDAALDWIRAAPRDAGVVELIVRRPARGERELIELAELDPIRGLVGDDWSHRQSKRTPDGSPNLEQQLTLMSTRAITAIAGPPEAWPPAGDQLFVDFDLSDEHLPAGTHLAIGTAVIAITAIPHDGCAKFSARYGSDAQRWVNTELGRKLRLRGVNARVLIGGTVRRDDPIAKLRP